MRRGFGLGQVQFESARLTRWAAATALVGVAVLGTPGLASAQGSGTLGAACVNPAGNGRCYNSVGAAVAAVRAGGVVEVAAGTYNEQVNIDKALTLRGAG